MYYPQCSSRRRSTRKTLTRNLFCLTSSGIVSTSCSTSPPEDIRFQKYLTDSVSFCSRSVLFRTPHRCAKPLFLRRTMRTNSKKFFVLSEHLPEFLKLFFPWRETKRDTDVHPRVRVGGVVQTYPRRSHCLEGPTETGSGLRKNS